MLPSVVQAIAVQTIWFNWLEAPIALKSVSIVITPSKFRLLLTSSFHKLGYSVIPKAPIGVVMVKSKIPSCAKIKFRIAEGALLWW